MDNNSLFIDMTLPLWVDNLLPLVFSYLPFKIVCEIRRVNCTFLKVAHSTAITETFYPSKLKPIKTIFQHFKFLHVVVNSEESLKLFIESLKHNHRIKEIKISPQLPDVSFELLKGICNKKSLRHFSASGSDNFKWINYVLTNSPSLTHLTIKKPQIFEDLDLDFLFEEETNIVTSKRIKEKDVEDKNKSALVPLIEGIKKSKLRKLTLLNMVELNNELWEDCFKGLYLERFELLKEKESLKDTDDFNGMLKGLKGLPILKEIVIEGFYMLGSKGWMKNFCNLIESLPNIRYICLSKMGIVDKDFLMLIKSVQTTRVNTLRLSWNAITAKGLFQIAFLIRNNLKLNRVDALVLDEEIIRDIDAWKKSVEEIIKSIKHSNVVNCSVVTPGGVDSDLLDYSHLKRFELRQELKENRERIKKYGRKKM